MVSGERAKNISTLDYSSLEYMRLNHPAWRLLRAEQAPLVASFLHRVFIVPNQRVLPQSDLSELLEDELYNLRQRLGEDAFPKRAIDYLNDWAANEKGWLRKFYLQSTDEPHFDLTPAAEKAIGWLASLSERSFIGTESRLLTLFDLLRQMSEGTESDPEKRVAELEKRRAQINEEIERISAGDLQLLDDTSLRDRFQQFVVLARELLGDFRGVEQNFRNLDRSVRERIALCSGGKGALLEEIMGERDAIADSDQGRSFQAFWDFLMSRTKQEELTSNLEKVLSLPPIASLQPDSRIKRIHYDWLEAGEFTQRTVAQLSQQLRRFLDDAAWLENKRIMEILHNIEVKAIDLRDGQPTGNFMSIANPVAEIDLAFERPLYTPKVKPRIRDFAINGIDEDIDVAALFAHIAIDTAAIKKHIRQSLQERSQIPLSDLVERRPLEHGLAELMYYLQLATTEFETVIDEDTSDIVNWATDAEFDKQATLPRIIFVR